MFVCKCITVLLPPGVIPIAVDKYIIKYKGADKSLARTGRKQATATEDFWLSYILFIIVIGGIIVTFIYITRLASNEIFSPSNKIDREVGRAKDYTSYFLHVIPNLLLF
jgi:hypothetical protein